MEEDEDSKKRTDWSGVIIGLLILPVLVLFTHFGRDDLGRSVGFDLGAILVAVRMRWDLRNHWWFWGAIVLMFTLHIPLYFLIHWPKGWIPAIAVVPFAYADYLITMGAVLLVEKIVAWRWSNPESPPECK
jgi:hypothetical protein